MTRGRAYALVALAAAVPRLVVLAVERADILGEFTEKSDDFARTFVASGTYGFIPPVPSAYTQPLYGFFLIPIYAIERSWLLVGLAQTALAVVTALLVYELGRRWISPAAGLLAALATTLSPYLVWHDVHVNREIVDQPLAAGVALVALAAADRRSLGLATLLGVLCGLAILGNARLFALPLLLAAYLAARLREPRRAAAAALLVVVGAAAAVSPWVIRNRLVIGCAAITTDARALWKANNLQTRSILERGGWIDEAKPPPGRILTPEFTRDIYLDRGEVVEIDECEDMRFFRREVLEFWREHPDEKARLAALGVGMLWDPRVTQGEGRPGEGTWRDTARSWLVPIYVLALYGFAAAGVVVAPRRFVVLALLLLVYGTLMAAVFIGATRYRVPWDFLLALLASAAALRLWQRVRPG